MMLRIPLLAVGILASTAAAQSEARATAAFHRAIFARNTVKTAAQKRAALAAIREYDTAGVALELIRAFVQLERQAEPLREKRRAALLRGGGSKVLLPHRLKLQPIRNLQRDIAAALGELRDPDAVVAMLRTLVQGRIRLPMTLRNTLAARAGDVSEAGLELLIDASSATPRKSSDKRAQHALPLLRALRSAGRRAAAGAPFAVRQLKHEQVDLRVEAALTLAVLCWPGSIAPLIECARSEDGRALEAMFDALERITGTSPGRSASAWRRWLAKEGGPYVAGEVRLGRKRKVPAEKNPDSRSGTGSYFGIPQDGNAILYVFDNSLSMRQPMPGQRGTPRNEQVRRIDRCRQELHRALALLSPRKTFNILAFANRLRMFATTMQPASEANLKRAHAWIDSLELELQTNIHDALELSFYLAGRGTVDRYYPLAADTMFFLSDGAPTMPKPTGRGLTRDSIPEILAAVRRWNPLQRLVIHTIGLGVGRGGGRRPGPGRGRGPRANGVSEFMRQLAEQNGGRFVIPK